MPQVKPSDDYAPRLHDLQSAEKQQLVEAVGDVEGTDHATGEKKIVHKKGQRVAAFPVDAREMVRSGSYRYVKGKNPMQGRVGVSAGGPSFLAAQRQPAGDAPTGEPVDDDAENDGGLAGQPADEGDGGDAGTSGDDAGKPTANKTGAAGDFKLTEVEGIGPETAAKLEEGGFGTVAKLRKAKVEDLTGVPGVGTVHARRVLDHVKEHYPEKK